MVLVVVNLSSIVPDSLLVPGEQFVVVEGMTMPCDAVIISGRIVADESMLTGESVPVSKVPINTSQSTSQRPVTVGSVRGVSPEELEDAETELIVKQSGSMLFGGTKVKACFGGECLAVCCRTGFRSAKGQLVASLLQEKEGLIHFVNDALWIILYILIFTTLIYFGLAVRLYYYGASYGNIVLMYLDSITVAVPPLLTASLTISTAVSVERLKKSEIFVTDTSRVNYAGMVNAVCFDKTGTLTQPTLNFVGASIVETNSSGELRLKNYTNKANALPLLCLEIMATCHSLSLAGYNCDEPSGDPLELELLQTTGWTLRQAADGSGRLNAYARTVPEASNIVDLTKRYEVLKHFEFTPERLRACTLLKRPDSSIVYLMKGSPEMVMSLCEPASIPPGLNDTLLEIARRGLRVIAIAYRECSEGVTSLMQLTQDQVEQLPGLKFMGLLFLSNALKEDTVQAIDQLYTGKVHCNMITGDHVFTAIAVASECGLINRNRTFEQVDDKVYIVDEQEGSGDTIVIDSKTNQPAAGLSLAELLLYTASSYHQEMSAADKEFSAGNVENPVHLPSEVISHPASYQIAVTGKGLISVQRNYPEAVVRVLVRYARVFARTKPVDKKYIVNLLMQTPEYESLDCLTPGGGFVPSQFNGSTRTSDENCSSLNVTGQSELGEQFEVLFCGDGANDMTALRASSVGVSLCDAETSVAAPITSRKQSPASVLDVIKEGRCSLITAYVLIVYNILYGSQQLFMACVYYYYGMKTGLYTAFIQDVFFALVVSLAITLSKPYDTISIIHPPRRFLSAYFITKLVLILITFGVFQIVAQVILQAQDFYVPFVCTPSNVLDEWEGYEATVIQFIALAQLMSCAVISNIDKPFREPWYYNWILVVALIIQFALMLWGMFDTDNSFLINYLDIQPVPTYFAFVLFLLMFVQLLVVLAISHFTNVYFFQHLRTNRLESMKRLSIQSDILRNRIGHTSRSPSSGSLNRSTSRTEIEINGRNNSGVGSGATKKKRVTRKKNRDATSAEVPAAAGADDDEEDEESVDQVKETDNLLSNIL